jgi:hypothetical protein
MLNGWNCLAAAIEKTCIYGLHASIKQALPFWAEMCAVFVHAQYTSSNSLNIIHYDDVNDAYLVMHLEHGDRTIDEFSYSPDLRQRRMSCNLVT